MKKTVIYCRVASKDDTVILGQEENLRKYAQEKGLNITAVYFDNGVSGVDLNRPAFNAMLDDIESVEIDCVIVKDLSRIGRNFMQVGEWLDRMTEKGIMVIGVNDMSDNLNSNNIFMPELREAIRQKYRETHSARVKAGIARKKDRETADSLCGA